MRLRDRGSHGLAAGLAVAALTLAGCGPRNDEHPAANARGRVVLVSIDTLRPDHLSLYGYHRPTTPFLEELAGDAVVFEQVVNNGGGTLPSHMTMLTSLYPEAHGVGEGIGGVDALDPRHRTLAEVLRDEGFSTAAFVDSGWMRGHFGFVRGFDLYDDGGGHLEAILPRALAWLEAHRRERFFLFVHTYDVHSKSRGPAYHCPDGYSDRFTETLGAFPDWGAWGGPSRRLAQWNEIVLYGADVEEEWRAEPVAEETVRHMEALYDGCIRYVDDRLKELVGALRDHGIYDDTLIVVTSDHGEEFGEHDAFLHRQGGFDTVARVPLLLKLPYGVGGGRRVESLAATVDLLPTLLDGIGLGSLTPPGVHGRSLLGPALGGEPARRATLIDAGVRAQGWKYLSAGPRLYRLDSDPGETRDLAAGNPKLVARLADYARRTREDLRSGEGEPDSPTPGRLQLTEEEIDQLRGLGYLD